MAARLNPRHQTAVREKIRSTQLVKRLENHALGKLKTEMTDSQVRASLGLLAKCVPDLQRVELTGEGGGPVAVRATSTDEKL
jgi:hypothetical protein